MTEIIILYTDLKNIGKNLKSNSKDSEKWHKDVKNCYITQNKEIKLYVSCNFNVLLQYESFTFQYQ